jgi:hypothetical protein
MPKIFEEDGYSFFFYSNEHRPIHVHVRYGAGEAVINIEPMVEICESRGLKVRELRRQWILQRATGSLLLRSGMKTLTDKALSAVFSNGQIVVSMSNGAEIRFPIEENPRLASGTAEQLNHIEISPFRTALAGIGRGSFPSGNCCR